MIIPTTSNSIRFNNAKNISQALYPNLRTRLSGYWTARLHSYERFLAFNQYRLNLDTTSTWERFLGIRGISTAAGIAGLNGPSESRFSVGSNGDFSVFAIGAWNISSGNQFVFLKGVPATREWGFILLSGSNAQAFVSNTVNGVYLAVATTGGEAALNKWHTMGFVFRRQLPSIEFYFNGKLIGSSSTTSGTLRTTSSETVKNHVNGYFNTAGIWRRALSAGEMRLLHRDNFAPMRKKISYLGYSSQLTSLLPQQQLISII